MNGYPFIYPPIPFCPLIKHQSKHDLRSYSVHTEETSCKSDETYPFYIEYLRSLYYRGYGQVREFDFPDATSINDSSLIIQTENVTISPEEMKRNLLRTFKLLSEKEIRKRFVSIHFSSDIYVIGGYRYDNEHCERKPCQYDYFYHSQTDQLVPMASLPDGRVSFALCTDGRYIICAGGHTYNNVPLKSVYMFDTQEKIWLRLPDLPAPTSGAGIALNDKVIHLLGGFDIIMNRSIVHGEYVVLDLNHRERGWTRRMEIEPGRARPLLFIIKNPENSNEIMICSAGGYEIDSWHKPHPIARLEHYNEQFDRWEYVDAIPDFQLDHELSYTNKKLYVTTNNQHLQNYDFQMKQWTTKNIDENNSEEKLMNVDDFTQLS